MSFANVRLCGFLNGGRLPACVVRRGYCDAKHTPIRSSPRRFHSSDKKNSATQSNAEKQHKEYMQEANAQMQSYHEAREMMRQGKLKNINSHRGPPQQHTAQVAVVIVFVAAFFAMPFLGKKIATDDEFRKQWIPAWYDFTVKKPEHAWTRDELHEQMLAVQRDVRERAIAGEFTPEKLQDMQNAMMEIQSLQNQQPRHRTGIDRSKIPKEWDKIHPGLDDNEPLDESND